MTAMRVAAVGSENRPVARLRAILRLQFQMTIYETEHVLPSSRLSIPTRRSPSVTGS